MAIHASGTPMIGPIKRLPVPSRRCYAERQLHRRRNASADVHPRRLQRAVGLFDRGGNEDAGAGLQLALLAGHVDDDRGVGRHDDLLLAVYLSVSIWPSLE